MAVFGLLLLVVAVTYVAFPLHGVLHRSVETVAMTEWLSWDYGSLDFGESSVVHTIEGSSRTFPYEERDGAVKVMEGDSPYLIMTRFGGNKLMTADGSHIFYLKSSMVSSSSASYSSEGGEE